MDRSNYLSPLSTRYASRAMRENFSEQKKFTTWRKLWIALAECEKELGLAITDAQISELRAFADDVNYAVAEQYEKKLRHDVMSHVHAFGEQCPNARAIIHLGATSCYVTDNTELIQMRDGLRLLRASLVGTIASLREFALKWKDLPTLGFTHFQPAQATTVGKRAALWLQDLVDDLDELDHAEKGLRFRGVKGATGTQASFLELFDGDHEKVRELDRRITARMGFERVFVITGQTYTRKLDYRVLAVLSGIAQSAHKFATDVRLLANKREIEEPFEEKQIGSSAMPWKRNPMRCERICALSRFAMGLVDNAAHTAANQWLERTLDDSANRRLAIAEMFLSVDAILNLYSNVAAGLVVYPGVVRKNLMEELPFLASEHLMMEAVKAGGDRQAVHEALRVHARDAARALKEDGEAPRLAERLANDPSFRAVAGKLEQLLDPTRFVGRAPEQVTEYVASEVDPRLARYASLNRNVGRVEL
ncbi:MAG: adenylosuccinate lyase [Planctomycetes bacterium]|nr:adenylosuccinate lyase [Planctomycetota bacterium]